MYLSYSVIISVELYVIVEFCRFGNLQHYLLRHRDSYINQVDAITGKINYNIGSNVLNRAYSVTSDWYITCSITL